VVRAGSGVGGGEWGGTVQLGSDGGEALSIYVTVPVEASQMLGVNSL